MSTYAQGTVVTPQKSRAEIERTLQRYGATEFGIATGERAAQVVFIAQGRRVRFNLPLRGPEQFIRTPAGRHRPVAQRKAAAAQDERERWRALALSIKAKLQTVESGIATFDEEFLANLVLPDGSTVAEHTVPALDAAYAGAPPTSLLAIGTGQ